MKKISLVGKSAKIDYHRSMEIARKFLEQHHSILNINAVLENEVWLVTAIVGLSKNDVKKVRIDANTGKILDYV
jgi:uncharacterized membrane protein YkoI